MVFGWLSGTVASPPCSMLFSWNFDAHHAPVDDIQPFYR
jgi:hypothetical protein